MPRSGLASPVRRFAAVAVVAIAVVTACGGGDGGQSASDAQRAAEEQRLANEQYEAGENQDATTDTTDSQDTSTEAGASRLGFILAKTSDGYGASVRLELAAPLHVGATGLPAGELTAACRRPAERASLVKVNYTVSTSSDIPEKVALDFTNDLSGSRVTMLLAKFSGESTWTCHGPGDYPGAGISWASVQRGQPQIGEFWLYVIDGVSPNDPDGTSTPAVVIAQVSVNGRFDFSELTPSGEIWLGCNTGHLELQVSGTTSC